MAERFPEWALMPFTWILLQSPHFAGEIQLIRMAEDGITKEGNFLALHYNGMVSSGYLA